MTDYPLTRRLFAQLLALDETDAQLPLEILINLHRGGLRAPLVNLTNLADSETRLIEGAREAVKGIEWQLDFWYPILEAGALFTRNAKLNRVRTTDLMEGLDLRYSALRRAWPGADPVLLQLLDEAPTGDCSIMTPWYSSAASR